LICLVKAHKRYKPEIYCWGMENNKIWYMHFLGEQLFLVSYPLVCGRDHPSLECRDYIKFLDKDFEVCKWARNYASDRIKEIDWKSQKEMLEDISINLTEMGLIVEFVRRKANVLRRVREGRHYYHEISIREVIPREDAGGLIEIVGDAGRNGFGGVRRRWGEWRRYSGRGYRGFDRKRQG
jgi:hypothetical protein